VFEQFFGKVFEKLFGASAAPQFVVAALL